MLKTTIGKYFFKVIIGWWKYGVELALEKWEQHNFLKTAHLFQVRIAPKDRAEQDRTENNMNDVKLAVLGGEGTGKSGEWRYFLGHGVECG